MPRPGRIGSFASLALACALAWTPAHAADGDKQAKAEAEAKAIRDARLPEDDHSDTCSMCGKFCAVRSMNKALAGEYIDIL